MSKRIKKAHNKLVADSMDKKEHYKLYKSGKRWLIAGVMVASFAGSFFGIDQVKDAQAATTDASSTEQATTSQQIQQPSVTLNQTPTTSAAPASSAPASAASVDSKSTQSSAPASSTNTQSSSSSEAAQPAVDEASQASSTASEATQPATDKTSQASSSASETAQPVTDEASQSSSSASEAAQSTTNETKAIKLTEENTKEVTTVAPTTESATKDLDLSGANITVKDNQLTVDIETAYTPTEMEAVSLYAKEHDLNVNVTYNGSPVTIEYKVVDPILPASEHGMTYSDLGDGNFEETADDPSDLTNVTSWFQLSSPAGGEKATDDLNQPNSGIFLSHVEYDARTSALTKIYPDTKIVVLTLQGEPFVRFYLGEKMIVQANNNAFQQDDKGNLLPGTDTPFVPLTNATPLATIKADARLAANAEVYGDVLTDDETTSLIRALAYAKQNSLDGKKQANGLPAGVYATTFGFTDTNPKLQNPIEYKVQQDKIPSNSVEFAASAKIQIKYVDSDGNPTDKDGNPIKDSDDTSDIAYETSVAVNGGGLNNADKDNIIKLDTLAATPADFLDDSNDTLAKALIDTNDVNSSIASSIKAAQTKLETAKTDSADNPGDKDKLML